MEKIKIALKETSRTSEDSYEAISYQILAEGKAVGLIGIMDSETGAYIERLDVKDGERNKGYGTQAIQALTEIFSTVYCAPDNEDAQRLYERIGRAYHGSDEDYIDQGYGVYEF